MKNAMTTTIIRVAKVKNDENIRNAGAHQYRHHAETPNANKDLKSKNLRVFGSTNLLSDVKKRLSVLTKQHRKDAVLVMDGVLSLSPEYFEGESKDLEKTKLAMNSASLFLKERYGENLVNAVVHVDEKTPHMHFSIVPIEEKENGERVLNAKKLFGRDELRSLQRDFFQHMKKDIPTLEAPNYGSKAEHKDIKVFYSELNDIKDSLKERLGDISDKLADDFSNSISHAVNEQFKDTIEQTVLNIERQAGRELKEEIRKKFISEKIKKCLEKFENDEVNLKIKSEMKNTFKIAVDEVLKTVPTAPFEIKKMKIS